MPLSDDLYTAIAPSSQAVIPSPAVLIYMIPGNPGLIEYYREFLAHLASNLQSNSKTNAAYDIHGRSLAGFEVDQSDANGRYEGLSAAQPPFSLDDQVVYVEKGIEAAVREANARLNAASGRTLSRGKVSVILMGHSVGAWILLQILARRQAAQKTPASSGAPMDSSYDIVGGICLFPTVVDIAKSPTGRKVAPFTRIPYFALLLHLLAKLLCSLMPAAWLLATVKAVTGMPDASAKVTTAFLQSKDGVRQALHMGAHELAQIKEDKWDDELWGRNSPSASSATSIDQPHLYFFWGADDHWVSGRTRDMLIASRSQHSQDKEGRSRRENGLPYMEVDSTGLPHAFCLRHNQLVAEKVAGYIADIAGAG